MSFFEEAPDPPELLRQPGEKLSEWAHRYMAAKKVTLPSQALKWEVDSPLPLADPDTRGHEERFITGPLALLVYGDVGGVYCARCMAPRRDGWKKDCPSVSVFTEIERQSIENHFCENQS